MKPTHAVIIDYFRQLNAALVDFGQASFFRMDLTEIEGGFRTNISFPAMAVESPDLDGQDSAPTNSVIGRAFFFTIYMNPKRKDYDAQDTAIDLCERIGWKIIARMRKDSFDPTHFLYNKFKVSSVSAIRVGPVFTEHLYGYRFGGIISGEESLKVDPADWTDIDSIC